MAENFWNKEGFDLTEDLVRPFEETTKEYDKLLDRFAVYSALVQALNDRVYRDVLLRRCQDGHETEIIGYIFREYLRLRTLFLSCTEIGQSKLGEFEHQTAFKYYRDENGQIFTTPGDGRVPIQMEHSSDAEDLDQDDGLSPDANEPSRANPLGRSFAELLEDIHLELLERGN